MSNVPDEKTSEEIRDAIKIDGDAVRGHLDELVRSTVEETLNQTLDAEPTNCAMRNVEEALVEMYLAGVSVRRVEDITEALWGTRVSSSTVSEMNKEIYERSWYWWKSKPSFADITP